jgi:16S rRNA processing protein RimM
LAENKLPSASTSDPAQERGSVEPSAEPHFLAVGRVTRPHGVHGEVRVELLTDVPERFEWLDAIYVGETNPRRMAIESVRYHQGVVLLRLVGYPTRDEAETLRGQLLQVLESEAVPLAEDEYFLYQLQGLSVFTEAGTFIGRLSEVLETGANNVFVVDGDSGQHLLPDIPDVIKDIDIDNGRITIQPLPGLIDGLVE